MSTRLARSPTGRLAPSPTGGLHLGHARTFLAAWLSMRKQGGRLILRVEDLDASRVRAGAAESALVDLRWLGLDWDEGPDVGGSSGPYVQSRRTSVYESVLDSLRSRELVYPCTCTRADVARAASAPHPGEEGPIYPGTCRGRTAADAARLGDAPFAWRLRVPEGPVAWLDLVQGPRAIDPARDGGDFIVARNGVGFAYQLAVAVDDRMMGVTEVVRGLDLVPSTPRQIVIHELMGWTAPRYGHVGLVLAADGTRLAKRDRALKLETLRAAGADPGRIVGLLACSLGLSAGVIPSRPADWVRQFDVAALPRGAWRLPEELFESVRA